MNNKLYDEHDVHSSVPNCTISVLQAAAVIIAV